MSKDENVAYMPKEHEFVIHEVKERWDIEETPTGRPRKIRAAYASWDGSLYDGALLKKQDLKKLRNWCDYQLEHFDDEEKETVMWGD